MNALLDVALPEQLGLAPSHRLTGANAFSLAVYVAEESLAQLNDRAMALRLARSPLAWLERGADLADLKRQARQPRRGRTRHRQTERGDDSPDRDVEVSNEGSSSGSSKISSRGLKTAANEASKPSASSASRSPEMPPDAAPQRVLCRLKIARKTPATALATLAGLRTSARGQSRVLPVFVASGVTHFMALWAAGSDGAWPKVVRLVAVDEDVRVWDRVKVTLRMSPSAREWVQAQQRGDEEGQRWKAHAVEVVKEALGGLPLPAKSQVFALPLYDGFGAGSDMRFFCRLQCERHGGGEWGVVSEATWIGETVPRTKPRADVHPLAFFGPSAHELDALFRLAAEPQPESLPTVPGLACPTVMLSGTRGTGKTALVHYLAARHSLPVIACTHTSLGAATISSDLVAGLDEAFSRALASRPCVMLFDEAQDTFPVHADGVPDAETQQLAQSLSVRLQQLHSAAHVLRERGLVVVVACPNPQEVHEAVREVLTFEVTLNVPDAQQREGILQYVSGELALQLDEEQPPDWEQLSTLSQGFSGADLRALCNHARLRARRRVAQARRGQSGGGRSVVTVTHDDFAQAALALRPSSLTRTASVKQVTRWSDVCGLEECKQALREAVVWPIRCADKLAALGVKSTGKGVLMYGPPGTGKTLLARAVATEAEANFLPISLAEFLHSAVGESEKAIRAVFRQARLVAPSVIFIDEFQAVFSDRGDGGGFGAKLTSELLAQMDGLDAVKQQVVVLAATNRLDKIDAAFLRPGRFDTHVLVGVPDFDARRELLERQRAKDTTALMAKLWLPWHEEIDLDKLADVTVGMTPADLLNMCRLAAIEAVKGGQGVVSAVHMAAAHDRVRQASGE